jgi:hypothetical protein
MGVECGRTFRETGARHVEREYLALPRESIQYLPPAERVPKEAVNQNQRRTLTPLFEPHRKSAD